MQTSSCTYHTVQSEQDDYCASAKFRRWCSACCGEVVMREESVGEIRVCFLK
jgi:hypothetical protein